MLAGLGACKWGGPEYESSQIQLNIVSENKTIELPNEMVGYVLQLWNESEWEYGITKTGYEYKFELKDGTHIKYSKDYGRFNDKYRFQTIRISEEQRVELNAMIEQLLQEDGPK